MSVARARADYDACALAIAGSQDMHLRIRPLAPIEACMTCHGLGLEIEAASVRVDLALAALISGPGSYPATRLAAVDAAREAGVAWG